MLMTDLVWNSEAQSVGVQIIIITFNILIITDILIVETELSKQILKIKQKLVKNPSWGEADQLARVEEFNLGPPNKMHSAAVRRI